jgi:hypothetical protein
LGDFFEPSLDDARAHLVVALDALLIHPHSQGRKVLDRFRAYVEDPSFAGSGEIIAQLFFDRVKPVVRRRIVGLAVKHALLELSGALLGVEELADRMAICVAAFASRDRAMVREAMATAIPRLAAQLVDAQMRALVRLGALDIFWETVDDSLREHFQTVIAAVQEPGYAQRLAPKWIAVLSLVSCDVARSPLPGLVVRFMAMPTHDKAAIIGRRPGPFFVPLLPQMLREAGSWRTAEAMCREAVMPCAPYITAEQLPPLLEAWAENYECRTASDMPGFAMNLYLVTSRSHPVPAVWWKFVHRVRELAGPEDTYFNYEEVARLLPPEA